MWIYLVRFPSLGNGRHESTRVFKAVEEWIYIFFCLPTENGRCKSTSGNGNRESTILFSSTFFIDKNRISLSHVTFIKLTHVETLVMSVRKVGLEFMERRPINDLYLQIKQNFFFFELWIRILKFQTCPTSLSLRPCSITETFAMLEFRQYFHRSFIKPLYLQHIFSPCYCHKLESF